MEQVLLMHLVIEVYGLKQKNTNIELIDFAYFVVAHDL
jgi:hypothetical protein